MKRTHVTVEQLLALMQGHKDFAKDRDLLISILERISCAYVLRPEAGATDREIKISSYLKELVKEQYVDDPEEDDADQEQ